MPNSNSTDGTERETVTDRVGTEAPASVDSIDLAAADECPVCGGTTGLLEMPAGYYHCESCWTTWAGDLADARLVDYCYSGGNA
jgi:hypothetical protein